jgi:hypothetical protein
MAENQPKLKGFTMSTDNDLISEYFRLTKHRPSDGLEWGERLAALRTLRRANSTIHRLQERECNGEGWSGMERYDNGNWGHRWTDADEAKAERLTENAYKRAESAAVALGGVLVRGCGDPRGYALLVDFGGPQMYF